jgi:hypothetical protein
MPKHVRVELERINKKIHYFLEHLSVFLQTILQDARSNHQDHIYLLFTTSCQFQHPSCMHQNNLHELMSLSLMEDHYL